MWLCFPASGIRRKVGKPPTLTWRSSMLEPVDKANTSMAGERLKLLGFDDRVSV
jgi:hypothetical protein